MPINDLIQTIVALSNMKAKQRELDIEQEKVNTAKTTANEGNITHALDTMATLPQRGREEFVASLRGTLPDDVVDRLSNTLPGMDDSPEVARRAAIASGRTAMSPAEKDRVGKEAYTGAATGQSRGAVASSGLMSTMLQNQSPEALETLFGGSTQFSDVTRAAVTRAATGGSPADVAVDAAITKNPTLVQQSAQVKSGGMTEAQAGSNQLGWASLNEQIDSAAKGRGIEQAKLNAQMKYWEAEARGKDGFTPAQQMQARNDLLQLTTTMTTKSMNEPARKLFAAQYNDYAKILGLPMINSDSEIPAAVKGLRALFGGGTTGVSLPNSPEFTRVPGPEAAPTPAGPPPQADLNPASRQPGGFLFGGTP
jgi:hypothetical protein